MRKVLAAALLYSALALPALADGVTLIPVKGAATTVTPTQLAALPQTRINAAFGTEHGTLRASFTGPLLWLLLQGAHAVPAKDTVRDVVLITGSDGYTASIALGEIAPAFEAKQVILAMKMDGAALAPAHWRLIVPGDAKGGRSVKDVVSVAVVAPHGS